MVQVRVRDATEDDLSAVADIANALLATTTYEWTDEPHTVEERRRWLARQRAAGHPALVAVDGGGERSIRFHVRLGFVEVARMRELGTKFGRRLDLVLLQRTLDP